MAARTDNEIMVEAHGGGGIRRVSCTGVRVAWEVSRSGSLSAFIPSHDALRAGMRRPKNQWVKYSHPTAGDWGGVVSDDDWAPGELEFTAEGWLSALLRKRLTRRSFRTENAPAGALMRKALQDAATESPLWLTGIEVDEDGEYVRWEWRLDDLYEQVLSRLLRSGEFEATVTPERVFKFQRRIGHDVSHQAHLSEGVHITAFDYHGTVWSVENDIISIGADSTFTRAGTYRAQDDASIALYGRRQGVRIFTGQMSRSSVAPMTRQALREAKDPAQTLEMDVIDHARAWSWFREGDTVRVSLPSADAILRARIMTRVLNVDAGVMVCSCDVDEVLR